MNDSPPLSEATTEAGLWSRLTGIVATPSETLASLSPTKPSWTNWVVPLILCCLMAVVHVFVIYSVPAIQSQVREWQEQSVRKSLAKKGLSQEQQTEAMQRAEAVLNPTVLKIGGSVSAVLANSLFLFLETLGLWAIARWILRSPLPYGLVLEVAGLTLTLTAIGGLANMLLAVGTGSPVANAGPILLVGEYQPDRLYHQLALAFDLGWWWRAVVIGLGLALQTKSSPVKGCLLVTGLWAALKALTIVGIHKLTNF